MSAVTVRKTAKQVREMDRKNKITDIQADILTTAMDTGTYNGARIPWSVLWVPHTWSQPLAGLVRRGFLKEFRNNMFDVTPDGESALEAWKNDVPPMATFR